MSPATIRASFLIAAGISFLLSVYLWFTGAKDQGVFETLLLVQRTNILLAHVTH